METGRQRGEGTHQTQLTIPLVHHPELSALVVPEIETILGKRLTSAQQGTLNITCVEVTCNVWASEDAITKLSEDRR